VYIVPSVAGNSFTIQGFRHELNVAYVKRPETEHRSSCWFLSKLFSVYLNTFSSPMLGISFNYPLVFPILYLYSSKALQPNKEHKIAELLNSGYVLGI
jgi:hypothetical protein